MDEKNLLIDLEGLSAFKTKMDSEIDTKISGAGLGVTYSLSKNTDGEIVLTGSDSSETKVSDANTTYTFVENNHILTITGSDGTSEDITLGGEITKQAIIDALGFTPMESYTEIDPTVPDCVKSISEEDISSWDAKADMSDIPTTLPASDVKAWAKADNKPTYTASEVGAIATTERGSNNGVASLDENGKIPSSQLPSYVDDVVEGTLETFPLVGESGKIYVDVETNISYRWSGTTYVEIGSSLALGETASTAYAGDKGKANADAIAGLKTTVDALPTSFAPADAQANVIETVKVNGTALTPSSKAVNITVPTQASDIGALPDDTEIPTESVIRSWGYTKTMTSGTEPTEGTGVNDVWECPLLR